MLLLLLVVNVAVVVVNVFVIVVVVKFRITQGGHHKRREMINRNSASDKQTAYSVYLSVVWHSV